MTANYTDTGIDLEIHDTATLTSLIWLRERVQSHIDAMTPTLAETIQAGPVQVVEPKSDPDCPRCKGTGLLPHVLYDPAEPCDCFGWGGEVPSEPEWSPWFDWSGGESPVKGCKVNTFHVSGVEDMDWANCFWWDHKPLHAFSEGNITRYRVLLSTIPKGWSLIGGRLIEDLPSEKTEREKLVDALDETHKAWKEAGKARDAADYALCDFDIEELEEEVQDRDDFDAKEGDRA